MVENVFTVLIIPLQELFNLAKKNVSHDTEQLFLAKKF